MAPRDTFYGVGIGRKAGSEVGEAIRWGHLFSDNRRTVTVIATPPTHQTRSQARIFGFVNRMVPPG